jgi:4-hydroxy-tetrahydrodipicolinate reductase
MSYPKLGILGVTGKMGQALLQILSQQNALQHLVGGTGRNQEAYRSLQTLYGLPDLFSPELLFQKADYLIDVTLSDAFDHHLALAIQYRKPYICAMTGLSEDQEKRLIQAMDGTPIVPFRNFSWSSQILTEILPKLKALQVHLPDVSLIEKHHHGKKDSPAGSAIQYAKQLGLASDQIISIRAGQIPAEYLFEWVGDYESFSMSYRVWDRRSYALGLLDLIKSIDPQKSQEKN